MNHSIIFTGHMIDVKDRTKPRFPAQKEIKVRAELEKVLIEEVKTTNKKMYCGIAGGACGGDILFHELCFSMGIRTKIYLALPVVDYKKKSVSFAGMSWVNRFNVLIKKLPVHILPEQQFNDQENIWEKTNLWMLHHALEFEHVTLIALWDYKSGDGKGGTEHMIKIANDKGAKVKIININLL